MCRAATEGRNSCGSRQLLAGPWDGSPGQKRLHILSCGVDLFGLENHDVSVELWDDPVILQRTQDQ
jgi:hypothetical protein